MAISCKTVCALGLVALSCFVFRATAQDMAEIECNVEIYNQAVALEKRAPDVAVEKVLACQKKSQPSLTASVRQCPDGKTYYISTLLTGILKEPMEFATCALETLEELRKVGLPADQLAILNEIEIEATDLFMKVFGHMMG